MKKKQIKFSNFVMIVLLVLAIYYIYVEMGVIRIDAVELSKEYLLNKNDADKKFLNKEIELTGIAAAFYEFSGEEIFLELESENDKIGIYCIIQNENDSEKADWITRGTRILLNGICEGMLVQKFANGVYIKVNEIK